MAALDGRQHVPAAVAGHHVGVGWETVADESDAAVDALFDLARDVADRGAERAGAAITNLAVVAALRAGLTVDEAQLREPLVRVSPRSAGG